MNYWQRIKAAKKNAEKKNAERDNYWYKKQLCPAFCRIHNMAQKLRYDRNGKYHGKVYPFVIYITKYAWWNYRKKMQRYYPAAYKVEEGRAKYGKLYKAPHDIDKYKRLYKLPGAVVNAWYDKAPRRTARCSVGYMQYSSAQEYTYCTHYPKELFQKISSPNKRPPTFINMNTGGIKLLMLVCREIKHSVSITKNRVDKLSRDYQNI